MKRRVVFAVLAWIVAGPVFAAETPATFVEPPVLAARVAAGELPPVAERLPENPSIANMRVPFRKPGRHGGDLKILMGSAKDIKRMVVYGYARLVGFDHTFNLRPDILESYQVVDGRTFTLNLRKGHRWSDGHPFTTEDFRYFWEDFATDPTVSPGGPPVVMLVDGERPIFEVVDETTVRYTWSKPNPYFIPALAGAAPLFIYRPAHYMKRFHAKFTDAETLQKRVEEQNQRNWVALQYHMGRQYRNNNPALPTLQPWILATEPPSERYVFKRNPYFHRIDPKGLQLPYIDQWTMTIVGSGLISAKVGTGESQLQAIGLQLANAPFLKEGEDRNDYSVRLWRTAQGAHIALFPNLNTRNEDWRPLVRNADFRRALSMAVNRADINHTIYFGLAIEGNNTVLPDSPLYEPDLTTRWAEFDPDRANAILDALGLTERDERGIRLLPNGKPMDLIVETVGESMERADVLHLVAENWRRIGINLHTRILQREIFRNRVFAGSTVMAVWSGIENGLPSPDTSPHEFAPTSQMQLQWPKWGQHFETKGKAGSPVDLDAAAELERLNEKWPEVYTREAKEAIWRRMLAIHADQVFTIGIVAGVPQPVVVSNRLRNVPEKGVYNWNPGAHLGVYRPDAFWFAEE